MRYLTKNSLSVLIAMDAAKSSGVMMLMLGCFLVGIFLQSGVSCDSLTIVGKQPSIGMLTKNSDCEEFSNLSGDALISWENHNLFFIVSLNGLARGLAVGVQSMLRSWRLGMSIGLHIWSLDGQGCIASMGNIKRGPFGLPSLCK